MYLGVCLLYSGRLHNLQGLVQTKKDSVPCSKSRTKVLLKVLSHTAFSFRLEWEVWPLGALRSPACLVTDITPYLVLTVGLTGLPHVVGQPQVCALGAS